LWPTDFCAVKTTYSRIIDTGFHYSIDVRRDIVEQDGSSAIEERARQRAEVDFGHAQKAYRDGDYAQAERLFADKKLNQLPASYAPNRTQWQAATALRLRKYAVARDLLVKAEQEAPNAATVFESQTEAFYRLGEFDRALAASERYIQLAGVESDICVYRGFCLKELKRSQEAAVEFRRALDDNPDQAVALAYLGEIVGAAGVAELEARYRKFADPSRAFPDLLRWGGTDPMVRATYVKVAREKAPTDTAVLFEDARLKAAAGNVAAALPLYRQAIDATTEREAKERLHDQLAGDAVAHHFVVAAYQSYPNAEAAAGFSHLTSALEDECDLSDPAKSQEFEALMNAHHARQPKDIRITYYEGVILHERKQYEQAEICLANAMSRATDDAWRETLRWRRVQNFADANRIVDAYTRVGPVRATFQQLANNLEFAKDSTVLARLVWIHGKAAPSDPQLRFWRGHLAFRGGRYEEAVAELQPYLTDEKAADTWRARNELIRSLIRLKRYADARAALPPNDGLAYYSRTLAAAVTAASGDVTATEKALDALIADHIATPASFHADEDLSAALRTEPFRRLLEKYPPPRDEPGPAKKE
jgi:tetratricopeptide (TPR) repeat protein